MGSNDGESDERPIHTVYLDASWIDQTEVTNAMYVQFLNVMGNREEGGLLWLDSWWIDQSEGAWQVDSEYIECPVTLVHLGANSAESALPW